MAHPDPSKRHRSKRNPNRASTTGTLFDIANIATGGKLGLTNRVFSSMNLGGGGGGGSSFNPKKKFKVKKK